MNLFKRKKYHPIDRQVVAGYNEIRLPQSRLLCKAPFNSVFFAPGGKILACWYNKREELGTYPEDTVAGIWQGEKIRALRRHLRHRDLSYGCEFCYANLIEKNYHKVDAFRYDYLPDKPVKNPQSFDFQISNDCNLECIMCNGELSSGIRCHRENGEPYDNPYDLNFLQQIEPYFPTLREAAFSGGEPFLIPLYYEIWESMSRINPAIRISVNTNGTVYNERVEKLLNTLNFNLAVSIDAVTEKTYQQIRRKSNFELVMEHFSRFQDYTSKRGTTLSIKTCPMRQNIGELHEIVSFANQHSVPVFFNTVVYPPQCSLWNEPAEQIAANIRQLKAAEIRYSTNDHVGNRDRFNGLVQQLEVWEREARVREKILESTEVSIDARMQLVKNKIATFIASLNYYVAEEKSAKSAEYAGFIEQTINLLASDTIRLKAAEYLYGLPVARLLAEIEFRTPEKMADRLNCSDY